MTEDETPDRSDGVLDDFADESEQEPPRKKRRPLLIAGGSLLTLLLVVALGIGGFAAYLSHQLDSNVRRSQLLPDGERAPIAPQAGSARNILLLGSDSRTSELQNSARADVIQLVHIPNDRKSVQVIHFPRDLYVDIPGRGKNKINAAFAFGGAPLLVQTLERLLGVRVDHVATIGFDGFKALTDTVGGVEVNVEQASNTGPYRFTPGRMQMNGDMALAFVRERKQLAQGDIDRGKRQQAWINGLLSKVLTRGTLGNPATVSSLVADGAKNLVVDEGFSTGQIRSLALSLRGVRRDTITFSTAPFSGFGSVRRAGSIVVVDQPRMRRLGQALRTDRMADLPDQSTNPG